MTIKLDDTTQYTNFDPDGMLQTICDLPKQAQDAWALAQSAPLPDTYKTIRRIVVTGMGGSAIGADLVSGLLKRKGRVSLETVRGYDLPPYIAGKETLVVMSSYSGNTEETLSAFAQAQTRGTHLLALTTGGKIAQQAEALGLPVWRFAYPSTPRAAVGYSLTLLLGLCARLEALPNVKPALDEAIASMEALQPTLVPEVPTAENRAKQLAKALEGRLPVIFGSGFLAAVARRWKCQFNENAKQWAVWDELPELNHNAVVGFNLPKAITTDMTAVCLRSNLDHPRNQIRWDVTGKLLEKANVPVHTASGQGESALAQMLTLIHFGDFVSYYLAALNGADPTPIDNINLLKQRLSEAK